MKAIATNSFHAWILAARPKTLTGAVIPVLTGSALAFADETFNIIPAPITATLMLFDMNFTSKVKFMLKLFGLLIANFLLKSF